MAGDCDGFDVVNGASHKIRVQRSLDAAHY